LLISGDQIRSQQRLIAIIIGSAVGVNSLSNKYQALVHAIPSAAHYFVQVQALAGASISTDIDARTGLAPVQLSPFQTGTRNCTKVRKYGAILGNGQELEEARGRDRARDKIAKRKISGFQQKSPQNLTTTI